MKLINTTDLIAPGWRFVEDLCPAYDWSFHHGLPTNALERLVRRPNLARYRAGWQAGRDAARRAASHGDAVLVSHLPRMAGATNVARRKFCPEVPQVAFSFNFTDLPQGADRRRLSRALVGVAEFVTFTEGERHLYAETFNQPVERFLHLPWAMDPPRAGPTNPAPWPDGYFSAIGGEARDYALMARAMRALPDQKLVIVARPHSLAEIDFPTNVAVFANLPAPQTWRIAVDSLGLVIPLRDAATTCGHITLVGAQLLGLPLVITRSAGVADYVDDETAFLVEAGDCDAMVSALGEVAQSRDAALARAARAQTLARTRSAPQVWADYFHDLSARRSALT
ncbi:MAG: hypothetical protein AAF415_04860 [Pseudomonadota bacterium]